MIVYVTSIYYKYSDDWSVMFVTSTIDKALEFIVKDSGVDINEVDYSSKFRNTHHVTVKDRSYGYSIEKIRLDSYEDPE